MSWKLVCSSEPVIVWGADACVAGRGAHRGILPRERLVGAGYSAVGIPATGANFLARALRLRYRRGLLCLLRSRLFRFRRYVVRRRCPYLLPPGSLYDISLEVFLNGRCTCRSNSRDLYWTFAQMIAHHTSNGCNLRSGDLYASGTVSGPEPEARGCLLEAGLPFLEDGDEVVIRGYAERPGIARIRPWRVCWCCRRGACMNAKKAAPTRSAACLTKLLGLSGLTSPNRCCYSLWCGRK